MSQVLHILKKDIRFLRNEIFLYWCFLAFFVWTRTELHPSTIFLTFPILGQLLAPIAAALLISRAIHAEAIPGSNRFWITRPYRWGSLLGAKIAFIVLVLHIPMLLTSLFLVLLRGFPLSDALWSILLTQTMMFLVLSIPLAALAAMTGGLGAYALAALAIAATAFVAGNFESWLGLIPPLSHLIPPSIRDWFVEFLSVVGGTSLLLVVFHNRRVGLPRGIALVLLLFGNVAYLFFPASIDGFASTVVTKRLNRDPGTAFNVQPGIQIKKIDDPIITNYWLATVQVATSIPLDENRFLIERFAATLTESGQRQTIEFDNPTAMDPGYLQFRGLVSKSFIESRTDKRVRMHAAIDFLSSNRIDSQIITLGPEPSRIIPGLQCNMDPPSDKKIYQESHCEVLYGSEIAFVNIFPVGSTEAEDDIRRMAGDIRRLTHSFRSQWPLSWGNSQYYFENPYYPLPSGRFGMDPIAEYSRNWDKPAPKEFRISTARIPYRIHREIDLVDVPVTLLPKSARGN